MEALFKQQKIKYLREYALPPSFEGEQSRRNIVDFIIEDKIILDLKVKPIITKDDYFQVKRYLQAAQARLGLIVNFRQLHLYPKRVLN